MSCVSTSAAAGMYTLSELPLVPGRSYQVVRFDSSPSSAAGDPVFTYADFICIGAGARIATPKGARRIESLRPGDRVLTRDHGLQPILWRVSRNPSFNDAASTRPVRIRAGAFGAGQPARGLSLSPQHRVLMHDATAGRTGFLAARPLTGRPGVRVALLSQPAVAASCGDLG